MKFIYESSKNITCTLFNSNTYNEKMIELFQL